MKRVAPSSPASSAGIRKGDRITACNGRPVQDWVDVIAAASGLTMKVQFRRGLSSKRAVLRRRPGGDWGLELHGSTARVCRNRCVFCFVDQQPPGLRRSLLVKDDDVRYSFLHGTYVTLTEAQTDEIIARGFSTVHVSVQATDPDIRGKLLGHRQPMPVLPDIDRLREERISVQAQVVEVPGWNGGEVLENTLSDLYSRDNVEIVGIVPVGLTRWRKGLEPLRRPEPEEAAATLDLTARWQARAIAERGAPWVFPGDEYYILAGREFPPASLYETCTLQANGIGLIPAMLDECRGRRFTGEGTVVTGELAAPVLSDLLKDSAYRVIGVENRLMGKLVGVAGLLPGADVIHAVRNEDDVRGPLFLPSVMFNHDGVTLDEYTFQSIGRALGIPVIVLDKPGDLP